jgi:Carrier-protein-independent halogenase WelO5
METILPVLTARKNKMESLQLLIDRKQYPLDDAAFRRRCRATLEKDGALVMPQFLLPKTVRKIAREGEAHRDQAYFCDDHHNVYLTPSDPDYPMNHPRNRLVLSSKGCIPDDIVPASSPLRVLYDAEEFKDFLCDVLGEKALYEYADPLSSINLHYAHKGLELGWHFDNSAFAITLMIQAPEAGGDFEYVKDLRDADTGEMNFEGVRKVLDGETTPETLNMPAGTLVLFRGRNSLHRVAPVEGDVTRMLVVLAYNGEPGIALSELARLTFFGRLN